VILFLKKRVLAVGVGLITVLALQAAPTPELETRSEQSGAKLQQGVKPVVELPSRPVLRRYEVHEDASGRLVRVAVRSRKSSRVSGKSQQAVPRKTVVQGRSGAATKIRGRLDIYTLVRQAGKRHGVDPKLIHAVIRQESNYNPFAVSHKGALGLMQLMPVTAERFGVKDIFDPAENVDGGVKFLRHLLDRYDGDHSRVLAAYNAGEAAVDRYQGIPPYPETEDFVGRVSRFLAPSNNFVADDEDDGDSGKPVRPRIVVYQEPSGLIRFETESD